MIRQFVSGCNRGMFTDMLEGLLCASLSYYMEYEKHCNGVCFCDITIVISHIITGNSSSKRYNYLPCEGNILQKKGMFFTRTTCSTKVMHIVSRNRLINSLQCYELTRRCSHLLSYVVFNILCHVILHWCRNSDGFLTILTLEISNMSYHK